MLGLLNYRNYYCNASGELEPIYTGEMGYWPIGVWESDNKYAAQPICYAAVVEGGNTEAAAKVIKAMLDQEYSGLYGFSVNNDIRNNQISDWEKSRADFGGLRGFQLDPETLEYHLSWTDNPYWKCAICSISEWIGDKEEYTSQLRQQLDNVVVAQISDREILSIWQDTLTEAIDSGISKEQGFEILCERMDNWYNE